MEIPRFSGWTMTCRFCCVLMFLLPTAAWGGWPVVAQQDVTFTVNASSPRNDISIVLFGLDAKPLYRLVCRGGSDEYRDQIFARSEIYYVPDLMCVLNEGDEEHEGSLLSEGQEPAWYTRGQFRWPDLIGVCGNYPEFGRVRHFRLRGMEITLTASGISLDDGHLSSFALRIQVRNARDARTRHAEPPGFLRPEGECTAIRKGVEPARCRKPSGDWGECAAGK